MDHEEITIRKTPFIFLKYLVIIEFTFALLPFVATLIFALRDSYDQSAFAGTLSYNLLLTIVMTTLQVLIMAISFMAWYLPSYIIDDEKIIYRRGTLFEDKKLIDFPAIERIEILQGWLARRLDYGSLVMSMPGRAERAYIKNIPNPANYASRIQGVLPTAKHRPAHPGLTDVSELIAGGENQYVEFKSSLLWDYHQQKVNKNLYEPVMKNLTAFMNTTGGALLIGVDDDGRILGLEEDIKTLKKTQHRWV
jgi:membrane protein YdbS with pleckstrin-like domain